MENEKSWLEISESRLLANFQTLLDHATAEAGASDGMGVRDTGTAVLAVVKAGAYGHGAELCAGMLARAGASWLGVADAGEGALVRRSLDSHTSSLQAKPRILVMCGSPPGDASCIVENGLTPVVWTRDQISSLAHAVRPGAVLSVHLEIDTGMTRQGVAPGEPLDILLCRLAEAPSLRLEGVLTHFASAEVAGSLFTALQRSRFEIALAQIAGRGLHPELIHVGNSSTIDESSSLPWLRQLASRCGMRAMVRSGIALYGYCLPLESGVSTLRDQLRPVLTWKSRILDLRHAPAGTRIGYNATFTSSREMRLALLPVGYADGLCRALSGSDESPGGWVLVHGRRAPIVGRISMNLTTVDITEVPQAAIGDEVTLLGDGVTADDHAGLARTISYEILCGIRSRPRLTA